MCVCVCWEGGIRAHWRTCISPFWHSISCSCQSWCWLQSLPGELARWWLIWQALELPWCLHRTEENAMHGVGGISPSVAFQPFAATIREAAGSDAYQRSQLSTGQFSWNPLLPAASKWRENGSGGRVEGCRNAEASQVRRNQKWLKNSKILPPPLQ